MSKKKLSSPFRASRDKAENFALRMYYNYCFINTLEELLKVEAEYQIALSSSNEGMIKAKRDEIAFYENIILLATNMMGTPHSTDSGSLHD